MYGKIVNHDLHWIAGDSVNSEITYKVDGAPQDLTGYTVTMVVRRVHGEVGEDDETLVKTFTSSNNHFIIFSPACGTMVFNLSSADTKALNPSNELKAEYLYTVELSKNQPSPLVTIVKTILRGKLYVHSEIGL